MQSFLKASRRIALAALVCLCGATSHAGGSRIWSQVADLSIPTPQPELLSCYQGESITYNIRAFSGGRAINLPATNTFAVWSVVNSTNRTLQYAYDVGSIFDPTNGVIQFSLTPAESMLPTGTYDSITMVLSTNAGSTTTNTLCVLSRSKVQVREAWSASLSLVVPIVLPTYLAGYIGTNQVDGTTVVWTNIGGSWKLISIAPAEPDVIARSMLAVHTNATLSEHGIGAAIAATSSADRAYAAGLTNGYIKLADVPADVTQTNETFCRTNQVVGFAAGLTNGYIKAGDVPSQTNSFTSIVYSNPAAFYAASNPSGYVDRAAATSGVVVAESDPVALPIANAASNLAAGAASLVGVTSVVEALSYPLAQGQAASNLAAGAQTLAAGAGSTSVTALAVANGAGTTGLMAKATADAALPKSGGTASNLTVEGTFQSKVGTNLSPVLTEATVSYPSVPLQSVDPLTMKKSGTRIGVVDWIPNSVLAHDFTLRLNNLIDNGGFLSGPNYWHSDSNGIVTAQSQNYAWQNPGWRRGFHEIVGTNVIAGLMVHYKMNDNAADPVITNTAGPENAYRVIGNTDANTVPGLINSAQWFDLANSNYATSETFAADFRATNFTISVWAFPLTLPEQYTVGMVAIGQYSPAVCIVGTYSGGPSVYDSQTGFMITSDPVSTGAWHHIAYVVSNSTTYLFVDNAMVGSAERGALNFTTGNCYLGLATEDGQGPINYFDGYLDDVRIYTNALTPDEVAALYNSGSGTEGDGGSTTYVPTNMVLVSSLTPLPGFDPTAGRPSIYVRGTNAPTTNDVALLASKDAGTNWITCTNFAVNVMNPTNYLAVGNDLALTNGTWAGTNLWLRVDVSSNYAGTVLGVGMPIGAE